MKKQLLLPFFSLLAVAMLLAGCDKSKSFTLILECDNYVARRELEVDIFAVNYSNKDRVLRVMVDDYWQANGTKRTHAENRVTKKFGETQRQFEMSLKDPEVKAVWAKWEGQEATDLMVVAQLTAAKGSTLGDDDRCQIIPLKPKDLKLKYPNAKAFRIVVSEKGVELHPLKEIPKKAK